MEKTRPNIFRDIYYQPYNDNTRLKLYTSTKASLQMIQRMTLLKRLKVHNGCVNSICWNSTGNIILSGSDDQHLVLTNAFNYEVLTDYKTSHRTNIFSAKFLPNSGDRRVVSCSGDGMIIYTDLMRRSETFHNQFTCHTGTTYEIATVPGEPHSFLSCGEDGTVRWFDLRVKSRCPTKGCTEDVLISCQRAVTALSLNPVMPHEISVGCSDSTVRTFDRRMLGTRATGWTEPDKPVTPLYSFTVPEFEGSLYRITSLSYSPDGQDVLVSYSSDHLYLFSVKDRGGVRLKKDATSSKGKNKKPPLGSSLPVRRLRLRGDWSDTGPDARPEREGGGRNFTAIAQARQVLHTSLMRRMTDVLSRMLNDPATRAALSGGGEDSLEEGIDQQDSNQTTGDSTGEPSEGRSSEPQEADRSETGNERLSATEPENESQNDITANETQTPEPSQSVALEELPIQDTVETHTSSSIVNDTIQTDFNVPMETEFSQMETVNSSMEATSSTMTDNNDLQEETRSDNEASCSGASDSQRGSMMENLHDTLTTMRDGYLEKHGSEPIVKLTYSDESSTRATISLGVSSKMIRDPYPPGPSGSHSSGEHSGDSSNSLDRHPRYNSIHEKPDCYITSSDSESDSDDDMYSSGGRLLQSADSDIDGSSTHYVKQKYMGHRNARTMIKEANFWGDDFVMSGSDCGHVFVWERDTAKLCMLLEADQHVVNCVQPHPYLPMLATSGIDYDVKLWAPVNEEPSFDESFADDLQKRNAVMLEETKDTITVPAVFMIRMLACLNQIRRANEPSSGMDRTTTMQPEEERRRDRRISRWLNRFRRYCEL